MGLLSNIAVLALVVILVCMAVLMVGFTVAALRGLFDNDSRFNRRQREFDEQLERVKKELNKRQPQ